MSIKYKIPSIERRMKYELAHRGWKVLDLRDRIEEVTGEKYTPSRVDYIIKTDKPNTHTLAILAEALGIDVRKFFQEEL